jgi:hypothetical protein
MAREGSWSRIAWSVSLVAATLVLAVLLMSLAGQIFDSHPGRVSPAMCEHVEDGEPVQVEVRNGAGTPGLAGEMTTYLRRYGCDVVDSGNWRTFDVVETQVIDRVGNPQVALRVARVLGLSEQSVVEEVDRRPLVDVTVVIGLDYERLPVFRTRSSP